MSGCIEWAGSKDAYGYGVRRVNTKIVKAHRKALADHEGIDVPSSSVLCLHSCDNPSCVNPDHLRWGTQGENVADAVSRGRLDKKLTAEQREEIAHDPRTFAVIADEYGISEGQVHKIRERKGIKQRRRML